MVVMHHALAGRPDDGASVVEWILRGAATAFWMGVDCFFVLSGFLITGILLRTRGLPHALRNFLARRALRTLPLYYATIFVCFVVLPHVPGFDELRALATEQLWFWLHLSPLYTIAQGVTGDGPPVGWMSTFWSLSVEEQFYLFWACTVMALGPGRRLWAVLGALLAGTLGLRIVLWFADAPGVIAYYCPFTRLDALLLGSAIAMWAEERGDFGRLLVPARVLGVMLGVALFVPQVGYGGTGFFAETLRFSAAALLFASLLVVTLAGRGERQGTLARLFTSRVLRACGKYSYAMYVFNKPIVFLVWSLAARSAIAETLGRPATLALVYVGAALLSFGCATVSWRVLEKPFLGMKRFFETSPLPAAGGAL
jgi:peptidoglycan/LPS O-acetylase OafA/YrhL